MKNGRTKTTAVFWVSLQPRYVRCKIRALAIFLQWFSGNRKCAGFSNRNVQQGSALPSPVYKKAVGHENWVQLFHRMAGSFKDWIKSESTSPPAKSRHLCLKALRWLTNADEPRCRNSCLDNGYRVAIKMISGVGVQPFEPASYLLGREIR